MSRNSAFGDVKAWCTAVHAPAPNEKYRLRGECDIYVDSKLAEFEDFLNGTIRSVGRGRHQLRTAAGTHDYMHGEKVAFGVITQLMLENQPKDVVEVGPFRIEFLRPVADCPPPPSSWIPHYEEVGAARVRAGLYPSVLRYGSHVRPIIQRLLESVRPHDYATDFRTFNE